MIALQDYLNRKELSNKARDEVLIVLSKIDYNTVDLNEVVQALLKFPCDICYKFTRQLFVSFDTDIQTQILNIFDKNVKPIKYSHIFCFCAAMFENGMNTAYSVLKSEMSKVLCGKEINKQIFQCLERAIPIIKSDFMWSKFEGWDERSLNLYSAFLYGFIEYTKKEQYKKYLIMWFNNNDHKLPKSYLNEVAEKNQASADESILQTTPQGNSRKSITELTEEINIEYLSIVSQLKDASENNNTLNLDLDKAKKQIVSLQNSLRNESDSSKKLISDNELLKTKLVESEKMLKEYISLIAEYREQILQLTSKYSNVESAYEHAGQQEVDTLRNKIKSRLSSEYEKYKEIKAKEPDLDYYEMLLLMLDEIYKVLKKNGISF